MISVSAHSLHERFDTFSQATARGGRAAGVLFRTRTQRQLCRLPLIKKVQIGYIYLSQAGDRKAAAEWALQVTAPSVWIHWKLDISSGCVGTFHLCRFLWNMTLDHACSSFTLFKKVPRV